MNDDLKKVRITLEKQPLSSERAEIAKKKKDRNRLIIVALVCLLVGGEIGLLAGSMRKKEGLLTEFSDSYMKFETIKSLMSDMWLYGNDYEDLNTTLEDNAYYGMTAFIDDPYTTYQSNEEMNVFASSINMNFVGVGITYILTDGIITVEKVYQDSPAQRAGIQAGDMIETVDSKYLDGLTTDDIRSMVLGEENTIVTFGVIRQGERMTIDVVRGEVDTTCFAYIRDNTLVLEINSFGMNTHDEIVKYLDNYQDYDSLVIDMRNNTGGYQSALEEIAGLFLPKGTLVMKTVDKNGNENESYVNSKIYYDNFKEIAILINSNTASAAEVLTMCLIEQHPNAYTVGETSYGKGVVQSTVPMSDGSALKVTTSKWLSPEGKWINKIGIAPDYPVSLHQAVKEYYYMMEDDETYALDSVSEFVRLSELCLDYLGYNVDRQDGYFDKSFENALNEFKHDYDLGNDDILDSTTYQAIVSALKYEYAMNPDKDTQMIKAIELINN